jgi:hypothetical protein
MIYVRVNKVDFSGEFFKRRYRIFVADYLTINLIFIKELIIERCCPKFFLIQIEAVF